MKTLLFLLLLIVVSCSPAQDKYTETISDTKKSEVEPPCDDEQAPKVEIREEGISLLEGDEGCKLEE